MTEEYYYLPWVPKGAWLEERYVRCGKDCRCRRDQPHGTYWRLCWRERGGHKKQRYVATEHLDQYQLALELRRQHVAHRRRGRRAATAAVARARGVLRTVNARTADIKPTYRRRQVYSTR
ncbi:MAG TPA: DUF6788 family protein [Dehalococcoidia bacterium]|nr:DUF6788 family protein [Dehalococcoidia bacterium]